MRKLIMISPASAAQTGRRKRSGLSAAFINSLLPIAIAALAVFASGCSGKTTGSFEDHLKTGQIYAKIGKQQDAVREFKAALDLDPSSAEALFQLGATYRKANDLEEAMKYFQQCLEVLPTHHDAMLEMGQCFLSQGSFELAIESAEKVIEKDKENAKAYMLLGDIEIARQNNDEAIDYLLGAVSYDPNLAPPRIRLTKLFSLKEEFDKAEEQCLAIIEKIDSKNLTARFMLVDLYSLKKDFDNAHAQIKEILAIDPDNLMAQFSKANIAFYQKDIDEAQNIAESILKKNPSYIPAIFLKANIYAQNKEFDEAIVLYQRLVSVKPDWAEAHLRLALSLASTGQIQQAISEFRQTLIADPQNIKAGTLLTKLYRKNGWYEEAASLTKDMLEIYPGNAELLKTLALTYVEMDRIDEAEEVFDRIVLADPDFAKGHMNLAVLYLSQKKPDLALQSSQEAIKLDPADTAAHNIMGLAHLQKGDIQTAISVFQNIKTIDAEFIPPYINLARIYTAEQKYELARLEYENALSFNPNALEALLGLGRTLDKMGDSEGAFDAYSQILEINPDAPGAHYALAELYNRAGDKKNAKQHLMQVSRIAPDNILSRTLTASLYLDEKDISGMKHELEEIIKHKPDFSPAHINLGIANFFQGNIAASINNFISADRLSDESSGEIFQALAWLYYLSDNNDKSFQYADKAIDLLEGKIYPLIIRSNIHMLLGNTQEAIELIQSSDGLNETAKAYYLKIADEISVYPDKADRLLGYINNALIYASFGWYDIAMEKCRQATSLSPEQPLPNQLMATILTLKGDPQDALDIYAKMLEGEETALIYKNIGLILMTQGNIPEAIKNLLKSIALDGRQPGTLMNLGMLYERVGDDEQALANYEKVIEQAPQNSAALNNAAWIMVSNNMDTDKALEFALKAESLSAKEGSIKDTIGWIHFIKGDISKAEAKLTEAINLMPSHPSIHYHMAEVLHAAGKVLPAKKELDAAFGIAEDFPGYEDAVKLLEKMEKGSE